MIIFDINSISSIWDVINSGGIAGLLVVILVGGIRRWWVFGWHYNEAMERIKKVETSNARWMELALKSTNLAETAVHRGNAYEELQP